MTISPNQGPVTGGTVVTIVGQNLAGTTAVRFGTRLATGVTQVSPTQVSAVSPPGTGTVWVTLTTPGGTAGPVPFHYRRRPFLCTLSPAAGPLTGGGTLTINGDELFTATTVHFGATSAAPTVISDQQLTVTVPASGGSGSVSVTVISPGGTSNSLTYTYASLPAATTLTPTSGTPAGATAFTINGTHLTGAGVTFDGAPATGITVNAAGTSLTGTTPAGTIGNATFEVSTPTGSTTVSGGFTYTLQRAYVTNAASNNLTVIDTSTNTALTPITVGTNPRGVAVTPDGSRAYVTNNGLGTVSVVTTATGSVTGSITVGTTPHGVAALPDGSRLYVANNGSGTVSVINASTNAVTGTITVGTTP